MSGEEATIDVRDPDVVVVGAGMAGLYLLYRLRKEGFSARCLETADDVGGTWYWNRYPGARCDIQSIDYSYSFDPELETEWTWSERYATQPEILRYLQFVADKHDLRRDIEFETRVESARWDDDTKRWILATSKGTEVSCKHYVMATGCLSLPKEPDIEGAKDFAGEVYFTNRWPHEGVDFTGKRVGVIGTGSSGIQSIPIIAAQADQLTIFQRTPNFSIPAHNGPVKPEKKAALEADRDAYREAQKWSRGGWTQEPVEIGAMMVSEEERNASFEAAWEAGELGISGIFNDLLTNPTSNEAIAEFVRNKIRATVNDPEVAEALCPKDYPFATKRLCLDTNYYETFNRDNVELVDLRKHPISTITATGIETDNATYEFDAIVFATGFDAMTGAIVAVDIEGRDGLKLADKWSAGPKTYLGLTAVGFPNFYMITGPGSPSVLSNMVVSIEQHVDWVTDTIVKMRADGYDTIEPTEQAEEGWGLHVNDCANITLFPQANSWYMGANVPGKPRMFLPYIGGVDTYRQICNDVVDNGYMGFEFTGSGKQSRTDGVIRRLQPDVAMLLEMMATMDLPPYESMSPDEARAFGEATAAQRPPGPEVGEIVDGTYPGADGDLAYRLYRPATPGPHPVVLYFHGGGWVLGSEQSDDPMCRDLCDRSGALIISANYRHAPEHRFPAAPDDAIAALAWVSENAEALGGLPGPVVVAGWSAGANLATVVAQHARDNGGPAISGQVLLTPVTDNVLTTGSYVENAEGYGLTKPLMEWFWDHYIDPADRNDPRASPLRASSLAGLPPATVITAEFDPLRDEGAAYAKAMADAGVDVHHIAARGHTHISIPMVDVMLSAAPIRQQMAEAITSYLPVRSGV
ncbi:MAG: alpha/beta hydrolase fold domain-containing protein [Acidimicrobiales bacterium]